MREKKMNELMGDYIKLSKKAIKWMLIDACQEAEDNDEDSDQKLKVVYGNEARMEEIADQLFNKLDDLVTEVVEELLK